MLKITQKKRLNSHFGRFPLQLRAVSRFLSTIRAGSFRRILLRASGSGPKILLSYR